MALVSSKVAAGMTILADHFNKLWTDLTQNHNHSAGQGGTVDHGDLADGVITGTTYSHTNIRDHIDAGEAVHDLASGVQVAGALGSTQLVIFAGSKATPLTTNYGTCYYASDGLSPQDVTFSSVIAVLCQLRGSGGGGLQHADIIQVENVYTTYFTYVVDSPGTDSSALDFLVIGTK
jgi:hypothetical protein